MWIRLAIGGALVLLCCLGGVGGIVALVVTGQRAALAQSTQVVQDYLDGLRTGNYDRAYDQLCDQLQTRQSRAAFTDEQRRQVRIEGYDLGTPRVSGSAYLVRATIRLVDGSSDTAQFAIVTQGPSDLRICGITQ